MWVENIVAPLCCFSFVHQLKFHLLKDLNLTSFTTSAQDWLYTMQSSYNSFTAYLQYKQKRFFRQRRTRNYRFNLEHLNFYWRRKMNEQLLQSKTDSAIDMRGDIPDFTSSTELFTYIRHGVTRCTQQTRGRSLFLILRAFQDTLRKYSQVLSSNCFPKLLR